MSNHKNNGGELDSFALNKETAYKGELGRLREEYCFNYIERKRQTFEKIQEEHRELVNSRSETISCGKGCSSCCHLFVGASMQEGEAICYYLYHNETLLNQFLRTYPVWRARVKDTGDLFRAKEVETPVAGAEPGPRHGPIGDLAEYARQRIPCPFLVDSACSIYPVRPIMCAGFIATSPAEWCDPLHPQHRNKKTYQITNTKLLEDRTFYGTDLEKPVWSFMPIMVYNMLEWGLPGMPEIAEKERLLKWFMSAPEVRKIVEEHLRRAKGES